MADELGGEHPRADPTEIVPSIIIRPIGGVAPSAQELPVPPLCGVPTERNPSIHAHTRGCTPGWYAVPRWGTQMDHRRPYPDPLGHPLESSTALSRLVEATPMNY